MAIASVSGGGVVTLGDATGGGSLLPAKGPPAKPPIALGRTYAPMKVRAVGTAAARASARIAPAPAPIAFGRPSAPAFSSSPTAGEPSNGASYAGPGYAPVDASASSYAAPAYDPSQSPTAAGGAASPTPVALDPAAQQQQMTLQQAQASGPAPVGYYVAGGAAVVALGLGIWLFTK